MELEILALPPICRHVVEIEEHRLPVGVDLTIDSVVRWLNAPSDDTLPPEMTRLARGIYRTRRDLPKRFPRVADRPRDFLKWLLSSAPTEFLLDDRFTRPLAHRWHQQVDRLPSGEQLRQKWLVAFLDRTATARAVWHALSWREAGPSLEDVELTDFARTRGYEPVQAVKSGKVARVRRAGRDLVFKRVRPGSLEVYGTLLPWLRDRCFGRLELPEILDAGDDPTAGPWIVMPWYEGDRAWGTGANVDPATTGGRGVGVESTVALVSILADLATVDPDQVARSGAVRMVSRDDLNREAEILCDVVARLRLLTDDEIARARQLLSVALSREHRDFFSNGDVNLRNAFPTADGRIRLIDWDHASVMPFGLERAIAWAWTLMARNADWQRRFLAGAVDRFGLDAESFRATLLTQSIREALRRRHHPARYREQLRHARLALRGDAGLL